MNPIARAAKAAQRLIDAFVLALLALPIGAWLLVAGRGRRPRTTAGRRLLVIDTSYSLHVIRALHLGQAVLARDLDGYFEHVWTVHPLAGADPREPADLRLGPARITDFAPRHTIIEAPIGRFATLRTLPRLNFVLAQVSLLRRLHRLVRREAITLVRIGDPYYQGLLGWRLRRRHGLPLVLRVGANFDAMYAVTGQRAYPRLFPSRAVEKWVERRVLKRVDLVAGANEDNLQYAVRNGADAERTAIFRYGNLTHPVHFEEPSRRPNVAKVRAAVGLPQKALLAYIGRLEPVKRAADLVDVMAEVTRQVEDVGLVVVGDGSLRPSMEARVRELGLADRIAFVGPRDQAWIASLMPSVAAIVSPHMGRALVEAALGGVPLVAYDTDWQAELVRTGESGVLVPEDDCVAMGRAAIELLRDPARARRLGASARRAALDLMNPAKLAATERAAYDRVLADRQLAPRVGEPRAPARA